MSVCYSLLPGVFDEVRRLPNEFVAILVSPLVALMRDQVRVMTERKVHAVYVGDAVNSSRDLRWLVLFNVH